MWFCPVCPPVRCPPIRRHSLQPVSPDLKLLLTDSPGSAEPPITLNHQVLLASLCLYSPGLASVIAAGQLALLSLATRG
jgi:hypothetical protein